MVMMTMYKVIVKKGWYIFWLWCYEVCYLDNIQYWCHQYADLMAVYWKGKKRIGAVSRDRERKMEINCLNVTENWPWVEKGGPVIDPRAGQDEESLVV
jgi:hypothetical protein